VGRGSCCEERRGLAYPGLWLGLTRPWFSAILPVEEYSE